MLYARVDSFMVSKLWLSDNLRVSKTYFLEVRGVLEHLEHPSGNATAPS